MSKTSKNKILSIKLLSSLFLQLSQLEKSGIPTTEAFGFIKTSDTKLNKSLIKMQQRLKSGKSIADTGFSLGIFNETHKALINAAENSGKLATVYQQQATYYTNKLSRIKKMKSRLIFPLLTLLLGMLIEPIPLLVTSKISLMNYLSLSFGRFFLIISLFFIAFKLTVWFQSLFFRVQLQLPIIKTWVLKRQINNFLLILGVLLDAGLAFSEALPLAVKTIKNTILRKNFRDSVRLSHSGKSILELLSKVDEFSPVDLQMIQTGEETGRLAETLLHYSNHEAELLFIEDESLAEWLPRIFYIGVALWMASSILGFG